MALDAEDTRAIIDDISKVYRVMGTVGEMAADRGYNVPPNWRPGSMAEFKDEYVSPAASQILRERMTLVCSRESDADLLLVLFAGTEPINSQRVKDFIAKAVDVKATTLVVIHAGKINPAARSYYMEAPREHERLHTELFEEDDLVVNITKHELVPKHEPLTSEQAKEVLQAYSLKVSMLPRILSRDPVALYYGMKKGGIVKITRKSETAGEYTTYRQVM